MEGFLWGLGVRKTRAKKTSSRGNRKMEKKKEEEEGMRSGAPENTFFLTGLSGEPARPWAEVVASIGHRGGVQTLCPA